MRQVGQTLLNTRFDCMANNTIDYWMKKDNDNVTYEQVIGAIKNYVWHNNSNLQIYLHVPYCTQKCTFCAFSGGNSRDFKTVERYSKLLVWQMGELLKLSPAYGKEIRSVNIGGGSPDLLRQYIGYVLRAVRDLPGCTDSTEISVELALPTVTDEFIRELLEYNVTKASFGVQVIDPKIRRYLGMPSRMLNLDEVCGKLAQNIPIINVDLLTGIPGQTIASVIEDLQFFINHQHVNSISTYALIPGAAPKLISDIKSKKIPPQPPQTEQALFRLHSYATLLRNGWIRKGTNSYMDPKRIPEDKLNILAGNESIGTQRYEDFLVGAGAQAIFYIPGARIEHTV